MTHEELMVQLKDIHRADPPSWWPPAFGYYVVVFGALLLAIVFIMIFRRIRRARMRKLLLNELSAIEKEFATINDRARLQASLSALFRRLAFVADTSLSRASDLDAVLPALARVTTDQHRMQTIVDLLKEDRYRKEPQVDGALLISLAKEQLKRCRI